MSDPRQGCTSASNALADSLCPGRFSAQVGIPEPPESKDASKGDLIHAALAAEETTEVRLALINDIALRETFDACRDMEKKLVIDFFGEQPPAPIRVVREQRLWVQFAKDGKTYRHSGQPDVVFRSGTKALICEYKTGFNEVAESPRNIQLRDQAVLVNGNLTLLDQIGTAVIQPTVSKDTPTVCLYSKEDLDRASIEMYERVIRSNDPNSPRIAGEVQCQFCKAKKVCAAYQKWAAAIAPPAILQVLDVPMANWTPEQRAIVIDGIKPFKKFAAEVEEYVKSGLKVDPNFCPGWTLDSGRTLETITDPQTCFDRFAKLGGKLEQFMGCVKVGKTNLKTAVAAVTGTKGKALANRMDEITEGIVESKQTEPSLVRVKGGDE